jgi:hypothetical protein
MFLASSLSVRLIRGCVALPALLTICGNGTQGRHQVAPLVLAATTLLDTAIKCMLRRLLRII